jgi:hypothetical protein
MSVFFILRPIRSLQSHVNVLEHHGRKVYMLAFYVFGAAVLISIDTQNREKRKNEDVLP